MRRLKRFPEDIEQVSTLKIDSDKGRQYGFDSWEYGIKNLAADNRDEELIYFFRRCAYVVKLTNDPTIMKGFKERFSYVMPVHLRERAWLEASEDRVEEARLEVREEQKKVGFFKRWFG